MYGTTIAFFLLAPSFIVKQEFTRLIVKFHHPTCEILANMLTFFFLLLHLCVGLLVIPPVLTPVETRSPEVSLSQEGRERHFL